VNADDAYRHAEQMDTAATALCALGVVLFLVLALGATIYSSRVYYRLCRRAVRKWRAATSLPREHPLPGVSRSQVE